MIKRFVITIVSFKSNFISRYKLFLLLYSIYNGDNEQQKKKQHL
jgi:hypothetical protein